MSANIKGNVGRVIAVVITLVLIGGIGYFVLTDVASASVTVVSPKDGEQWAVGTKQIIKWSSFNIPEKATIGIQLANPDLDEDGFWEGIADGLPNSGEYTWEIPKVIKNGPYKIYIYTQGTGERLNVIHDDTVIYISGSTAVPPKISKISPSSGSLPPDVTTEVINKNEVKEITIFGSGFITEENNNFGENKIDNSVYFSSKTAFALFGRLSQDGNTLTIPLRSQLGSGKITEDVVPGTYEIFVKNAGGESNSVTFVVEEPTTPSINVIQPKGGEVWKIGSTYTIQWLGKNIPVDGLRKISISLKNEIPYKNEGDSAFFNARYIFENIINDGQENWTIPSDIAPGDYELIITCSHPYQNDCPGGDKHNSFKIISR